MRPPPVTLLIRSQRIYYRAAFDRQGYIRPWFGITRRGRRKRLHDGVYYLWVDGAYRYIGNDPGIAVAHLKRELTKYSG